MRFHMELVFSAFQPTDDSDAAAKALCKAGFEVHRYPVKLRQHLDHPCDDFIEVIGDGPPGPCPVGGDWPAEVHEACEKFKAAVDDALGPYGCDHVMWGPIDADWVPFADSKHWGERWDPERRDPEPTYEKPPMH